MDDALLGLGDAYEAEAKYVRGLKLPEAGKARLESIYDGQAIAAYSKIVLEHSASRGVEDARDRLTALHAEIPKPTAEQVAMSEAIENSRAQYSLMSHAKLLVLHAPDVIQSARTGEPTLADPKPTVAPDVTKKIVKDFQLAMNPGAAPAPASGGSTDAAPAPVSDASGSASTGTATTAAAPLALQEVPSAETGSGGTGSVMSVAPASSVGTTNTRTTGSSVGVEIVSPGSAPPIDGMRTVGPENATPLPAVEKPADAPNTVNDIQPGQAPPAAAAPANGKKAKPEFDKSDESSSKHKKKKGIAKINPF
jgi:outer membrane protein assembly factor BamD